MIRTAEELLAVLTERGVRLSADDAGRLCYRAPRGALSDELRAALGEYRAELLASLSNGNPFTTGNVAAVLLRGTAWGSVWLIADDDALPDYPEIATSGLPVLRFAEVSRLQQLDADRLRALGVLKRNAPMARVVQ